MKKLSLTFAAIGLFFATTAQAQEGSVTTVETTVEAQAPVGDEFEKIELTELPAAVTTAITTDFAEATTQEAWVKEKEGKAVYKIKVSVDGEEQTLYADAEGNWIKKDMKHEEQK